MYRRLSTCGCLINEAFSCHQAALLQSIRRLDNLRYMSRRDFHSFRASQPDMLNFSENSAREILEVGNLIVNAIKRRMVVHESHRQDAGSTKTGQQDNYRRMIMRYFGLALLIQILSQGKVIDHWAGFENEAQLVKKIRQLMER